MQRQAWVSPTVEAPQIQLSPELVDISSCATEKGTRFTAVLVMAAVKGFWALFSAFFALLRVVPELSASFRSPRREEFFVVMAPAPISRSEFVDINTLSEGSRQQQQQQAQTGW